MLILSTSEKPIASIIIPTCDNLGMLEKCLTALKTSIDPATVPYEVIVVFQQMGARAVKSFSDRVRGLRALEVCLNLGFGGANNYAAKHARGEFLILLNDDTVPQAGWLEALVTLAQRRPTAGAIGSRLLYTDYTLQEAGSIMWADGTTHCPGRGEAPASQVYSYVREVDYCSANGLLVRRASFEAAGGFDDAFYPGYYEDADLCFSIRHTLAQSVLYEPRSVILHVESATMSRDPAFRTFLFQRHRAAFCEKWHYELATQYALPDAGSPIAVEAAILHRRGNPRRLLVVDDRLPDEGVGVGGIGSGFARTRELFEELGAGFAVTLYPSNKGVRVLENTLADLGVDVIGAESLDEHLARPEKRYEGVVISRPHNFAAFFETIRARLPNAVTIYDAEALYHRRLAIQAAMAIGTPRHGSLAAEAAAMERVEASIVRAADRVVAISEDERTWVETLEDHAPIEFMRPLASGIEMTEGLLEGRCGGVFVAGWLAGDESPNVDALVWFAESVMPVIRRSLPSFHLLVTGNEPPLRVQSLACDGIECTGFVESIATLYRHARVAIAPILAGAGVKIKTMEALQHGVPIVATAVGAEGLGLVDRLAIDIANDAENFAQRVVDLCGQPDLWYRRRRQIEALVAAWDAQRLSWRDVVLRALDGRGDRAKATTFDEYVAELELRELALYDAVRALQDDIDAQRGSRPRVSRAEGFDVRGLVDASKVVRPPQSAPPLEAHAAELEDRIRELTQAIRSLQLEEADPGTKP
jgi:O-antigen biosynthesis protein